MRPDIHATYDPATHTVTYLVSDPATGDAAIIDPVLDYEPRSARLASTQADRLLDEAQARGLTIRWVLETHAHADHLTAAHHIRQVTGAKVVIGARITQVQKIFGPLFNPDGTLPGAEVFDVLADEGHALSLGQQAIRVMATPGHTPACVTYLIGDAAFVGDTLFMPDYGTARADFPGGDARTLYRSIRKILALPPNTRLFTGHDYLPEGRTVARWLSTVAEQARDNVHLAGGVDEDAFVAMREARDATLPPPVLILPSLQVNIRAGQLPEPKANGLSYLQLPINALGAV